MVWNLDSRAILHLLEAEQSEEQLYQEISKVGFITAASSQCFFSVYHQLIHGFVFPGQRYLHSLLSQQQEVNREGEHLFLLCPVLPIR